MKLEHKIEYLQNRLYTLIEHKNYNLLDKDVIELSKILDKLVYECQEREINFS